MRGRNCCAWRWRRENQVGRLEVFADGAKGPADAAEVAATREEIRRIDWVEARLTERATNLGLGRNVLSGLAEIAAREPAFIVWEDDLVAVPGTYRWMCSALRAYADDPRVMSVTGWTHPRVTPPGIGDQPYFDGRAECWVWGSWPRAWTGMDESAAEKLAAWRRRGGDPGAYGDDLPAMAREEGARNIWAVRWLYHHLVHGGLCLRPPWSMVEHRGFEDATNAAMATKWENPALQPAPPVPARWPEPVEHPGCRSCWKQFARRDWRARWRRWWRRWR